MIRLEYFDKTDFQQLMMWVDNEELLKNWCGSLFNFPLTEKSLDWYLQGSNRPRSKVFIYKVIENATGKIIGHISLGGISKRNIKTRNRYRGLTWYKVYHAA